MKVCVIGGGASGMMCATMIARKGHSVDLYEKNEKLGKKLYITGKGRCNVTNATVGDEFLKNVINGKKFVMGAITRFNSKDTINFFEDVGIPLKVERGNRVFPESDKSSDIIKGLEKAMRWAGVNVFLNKPVQKVLSNESEITGIVVDGEEKLYDSVIVATGGISYPATGSTGDGYTFAKDLNHTIIEPVPALCAIKINDTECAKFSGLTLKNVKLMAKKIGRFIFESDIGELSFIHYGLSGPLALSCSSFICREDFRYVKLIIDLKPTLSIETLENRIDREIVELKAKSVSSLLEQLMPKVMVSSFAQRIGISLSEKANQLNKENRKKIAKLLKNYEYLPSSLDIFETAIITSGGINLKEINPKYMKSKLYNNLYFIGEVLDIDALTGGYNIQLAFSTAVTCASDFKDIKN
ncbi:MAG: NAD(P)/FAD-dependent oxidoreductase [Clostridia bacterium]|nr:NAD(P)/FAD-dependent oxidoreductase [Clostridia bacterium]